MDKMEWPSHFYLAILTALFANTLYALRPSTDFDDAMQTIDVLRKMVDQNPRDEVMRFNLAGAQFNMQQFEEAANTFRSVMNLHGELYYVATFCLAKTYKNLGQFSSALQTLEQLSQMEGARDLMPQIKAEKNQIAHDALKRGVNAYDSREFLEALNFFDTAIKAGAKEDAQLMKGLTLLNLGRSEEAKIPLRKILTDASTNEMREHARYFLERIESRAGEEPIWLFTDIGLGYNTNVFLDGDTESPTPRSTAQTLIGTGIQATSMRPFILRLGYHFYWEELFGLSSARFFSHTLRGQMGYQDGHWLLKVIPLANHQQLESQPFLLKVGAGVQVQKSWNSMDFGAQVEFVKNYAQDSSYSYLDGNVTTLKAYGDYRSTQFDLGAFYLYIQENTGDYQSGAIVVPQNNFAHGPGVKINGYFSKKWEMIFQTHYLVRQYQNYAQPGDILRDDNQSVSTLRVNYLLSAGIQLFGSIYFIVNRSSLSDNQIDDKNYSQAIGLTGVSWDILN